MNTSKTTHLLLSVILILTGSFYATIFGQTPIHLEVPTEGGLGSRQACGFERSFDQQMEQESYRLRHEALERQLYQRAQEILENPGKGRADEILTIPIVVHIVHLASEPNPGDGLSNPTDDQIQAGIDHLNEAYRNLGSYAGNGRQAHPSLQSVDVGIEFCLARRDINGQPTTGILRYANDAYTDLTLETEDPQMQQWVNNQNGGAYPGTDYANVWLVNNICSTSNNSCNIAGYAYFPGNHGSVSNGVINRTRYWGSSPNNSKVHIHEFGHYLSLYHTFQEGCTNNNCLTDGDRVCDTPPDNSTAYISCGYDQNSCTTDAQSTHSPFTENVGDLYENYMDYSASNCQNTFTQGQKDRMRTALLGDRGSLLSSQACIPVDAAEAGLTDILYPGESLCVPTFTPIVVVESNGTQDVNDLELGVWLDGVLIDQYQWTGTISPGFDQQITLDPVNFTGIGGHELSIEIISTNGAADPFVNNNLAFQSFQYSIAIATFPFCEDLESGSLTSDWSIHNPDMGVGFAPYQLGNCYENGNYVLALQTWGNFPSNTTVDELHTQSIDLSQVTDPALHFSVAYATYYSNFNTELDISISTDCGLSFTSLYRKTSNQLATAQYQAANGNDPNAFYIPADCSEWRAENIDLGQYVGQEIQIRFQARAVDLSSGTFSYYWGNNLYLDNICIQATSNGNGGPGGNCLYPELELMNGTIPSGVYDQAGLIYAGEQVANQAEVTFKAAESIFLLPGFTVGTGSSFNASIEACTENLIASPLSEKFELLETTPEPQTIVADALPDLRISPNPFSTQTTIWYLLPAPASRASLHLLDLNGRILKELALQPTNSQWQSAQLERKSVQIPAGLYLLRLTMDGFSITKKLVVSGN